MHLTCLSVTYTADLAVAEEKQLTEKTFHMLTLAK